MASPHIHASSSVKRWKGKPQDYVELHKKMDCSKGYFSSNIHRCLTHTMFWIKEVMVPLFGDTIINSDGKEVSVTDICTMHVLEDYGMKFVPTVSDWLQEVEVKKWMIHGMGEVPPSAKKMYPNGVKESDKKRKTIEYKD